MRKIRGPKKNQLNPDHQPDEWVAILKDLTVESNRKIGVAMNEWVLTINLLL